MSIEQEREAFERTYRAINEKRCVIVGMGISKKTGAYHAIAAQDAWDLWQARAALDQRQGGVVTDEMALKVSEKYLECIVMIDNPSHMPADQLRQAHIDAMRAALQSVMPVSVPDALPSIDTTISTNVSCEQAYVRGWNTCRTAMLSAATSHNGKKEDNYANANERK